jgi:biotin transport system substrate-specific component
VTVARASRGGRLPPVINELVRALATWSGAIAGLLLILVGGLIQAAVSWPSQLDRWSEQPLPITLQVPALLLTALVCGPRSALLASVGYLSLGLWQLPVFHGGGGAAYLLDPGFGFLAGFVPAAWLSGRLARQSGMNDLLRLLAAALIGLAVLQLCGVLNLVLGSLTGRWGPGLPSLLFAYSLAPLPSQMLLCCAVALVAWGLRRLLLVDP